MRSIAANVSGEYITKDAKNAGVRGEGNATELVITFDSTWDGLAKKCTWWDAKGQNPVVITLTTNLIPDPEHPNTYVYMIPAEPLAETGTCMMIVDGYQDSVRARTAIAEFEVLDAPIADEPTDPTDPTPTQAEQLQAQIDAIKQDIIGAAAAADAKEAAEAAAESAEESAQSAAQSASSAASAASSAASSAQSAANSAQLAQSAVGKTSYIGENGNWFEWDSELGAFVDSGIPATGLRDQNSGEIVRFWFGTVAEYNALTTIRSDTYYNILEGEV